MRPAHTIDLRNFTQLLLAERTALRDAVSGAAELRAAVIGTWHGRMVNEWMSAHVFIELAGQLEAIDEPHAAAEARGFAREERRHGVLCGSVVEAAGGEPRAVVAAPRRLPAHDDSTRRVAVLRNVLSICCLSETVAVALIGAERLEMPEGPLRELLTEIWADEVGHARFGWALLDRLLPQLSAGEQGALVRYLPYALAHLEEHELAHLPVSSEPPLEGRAFGVCSGRAARSLFFDTVERVIVPELARRGLFPGFPSAASAGQEAA